MLDFWQVCTKLASCVCEHSSHWTRITTSDPSNSHHIASKETPASCFLKVLKLAIILVSMAQHRKTKKNMVEATHR